jgi:hypothetical protein
MPISESKIFPLLTHFSNYEDDTKLQKFSRYFKNLEEVKLINLLQHQPANLIRYLFPPTSSLSTKI